MGDTYTQSPLSGGVLAADGFIRGHNGRRDIKAPGYTVWSVGASYQFRSGLRGARQIQHRVQLNVKNLFDLKHINNLFRAAARRTVIGGYSVAY